MVPRADGRPAVVHGPPREWMCERAGDEPITMKVVRRYLRQAGYASFVVTSRSEEAVGLVPRSAGSRLWTAHASCGAGNSPATPEDQAAKPIIIVTRPKIRISSVRARIGSDRLSAQAGRSGRSRAASPQCAGGQGVPRSLEGPRPRTGTSGSERTANSRPRDWM